MMRGQTKRCGGSVWCLIECLQMECFASFSVDEPNSAHHVDPAGGKSLGCGQLFTDCRLELHGQFQKNTLIHNSTFC